MPAGEKKDALLGKIIKRIDRSQAFCQQRNQPVTLSYSEDLPVSEKRNDILSAIKNNQVVVVAGATGSGKTRSEEHTSELQSRPHLVCRLLLEKRDAEKAPS